MSTASAETGGARTLEVEALARVEGEGGLRLRVEGGRVTDVALRIWEPPRFFEAFLRGRHFTEAPDLTARICGICPVAYQMTACHALEAACGVTVGGPLRLLRRLLYCGEWIESHALHVYCLHAPDFLGLHDVVALAQRDPKKVAQGLQVKKAGNALVALVGGREIHPINVKVGGFHRVPQKAEFAPLVEQLKIARDAALEGVHWVAGFEFPDFERTTELVALRHPDEYPLNEGRLVSSQGLDVPAAAFAQSFVEEHVERSHALHCRLRARGAYQVGPLARFNLNYDRLSPLARQAAIEGGIGGGCKNPFRSIVVRAVELAWACDEALRLIAAYEPPESPAVEVRPRGGAGAACTEAPRGILHHAYRIDEQGLIEQAQLTPPTSQNLLSIEDDLRDFAQARLGLDEAALQWQCEQAVRNYDPCISCATHALRLTVERA